MKRLVIAIDGPAASGKSTTAKLVAQRLEYLYVDTGAMYRAMTLKVLQQHVSIDQEKRIVQIAENTSIRLGMENGELRVFLDNQDVTKAIRSQAVTKCVSAISMNKNVREVMVREQKRMGQEGGVVLEGRDIGTVVFPDADLKIFMVAEVQERALRRRKELQLEGIEIPLDELANEILERDRKDSRRAISPLRKAEDAIVLDTSRLTIPEQVDFIVTKAKEILQRSL